jgi:hypothetical protein
MLCSYNRYKNAACNYAVLTMMMYMMVSVQVCCTNNGTILTIMLYLHGCYTYKDTVQGYKDAVKTSVLCIPLWLYSQQCLSVKKVATLVTITNCH